MREFNRRSRRSAVSRGAAGFATLVTAIVVLQDALIDGRLSPLGVATYAVIWTVMWVVGAIWLGYPTDFRNRSDRGKARKAFETVIHYDNSQDHLQQAVLSATRDLLQKNSLYSLVENPPGSAAMVTPPSLRSFGEEIVMSVEDSSIRVRSECLNTAQRIDWGKNRKNVGQARRSLLQASPTVL